MRLMSSGGHDPADFYQALVLRDGCHQFGIDPERGLSRGELTCETLGMRGWSLNQADWRRKKKNQDDAADDVVLPDTTLVVP